MPIRTVTCSIKPKIEISRRISFTVNFKSLLEAMIPKFFFIIPDYHTKIGNIAWELAKANSLVAELNTEVPSTEVLHINS